MVNVLVNLVVSEWANEAVIVVVNWILYDYDVAAMVNQMLSCLEFHVVVNEKLDHHSDDEMVILTDLKVVHLYAILGVDNPLIHYHHLLLQLLLELLALL